MNSWPAMGPPGSKFRYMLLLWLNYILWMLGCEVWPYVTLLWHAKCQNHQFTSIFCIEWLFLSPAILLAPPLYLLSHLERTLCKRPYLKIVGADGRWRLPCDWVNENIEVPQLGYFWGYYLSFLFLITGAESMRTSKSRNLGIFEGTTYLFYSSWLRPNQWEHRSPVTWVFWCTT